MGWSGTSFEVPKHLTSGVSLHPAGTRDGRFKDALVAPSAPNPLKADEGSLLAIDESEMSAGFVISSAALDRHGDNVLPSGCLSTLDCYHRNPVVFFAHKSEGLPIGLARPRAPKTEKNTKAHIHVRESDIVSRVWFHGKTQESDDVFRLVAEGVLRAASIGFLPLRGRLREGAFDPEAADDGAAFDFDFGGILFEEWQLLEWSIVPVPANADAIRSWLDPNKRLAQSLRKSLAPYAAPKRASLFFSRRTPNLMAIPKTRQKRKKGGAPLPPESPNEPTDEGRIDKADVQCVEFDVGVFPEQDQCKSWLEANGFDDVEMTPDHGQASAGPGAGPDVGSKAGPKASGRGQTKGGAPLEPRGAVDDDGPPVDDEGKPKPDGDPENWFFCLFADTECEADSHRIEEVEQGVKFHCCKRQSKPAPGDEENAGEPTGGDSYDKGPKGRKAEDPVEAGVDDETADVGPDDAPQEATRTYGAEVLSCVSNYLCDLHEYLDEAVKLIEHPKVLKYAQKLLATVSKLDEDVVAFGSATYPDQFDAAEGSDAPDGPSESDEPSDEGDEEDEKKPWGKYFAGTKALTKKQSQVVVEAAEFFEELSAEDNLKRSQKAASRLHAQALRELSASGDEPKATASAKPTKGPAAEALPSDEEVRAVLAEIAKVSASIDAVNEKYYEQTGTSLLHD